MLRDMTRSVSGIDSPEDFVEYWRSAGAPRWFGKDAAFDTRLRDRFLSTYVAAGAGELEGWLATATGALGLVLLLDQFPRNAFRGTRRAYATDRLARKYAERAIDAGFDREVPEELRLFFYLPFAHSEVLEDQERSVELHERIGYTANARRHRGIIRRFGRFPHRNPILGRPMTKDEQAFLDAGGFAG